MSTKFRSDCDECEDIFFREELTQVEGPGDRGVRDYCEKCLEKLGYVIKQELITNGIEIIRKQMKDDPELKAEWERIQRVVYSLRVEDLEEVAEEYLNRELTNEELEQVINRLDRLPWYETLIAIFEDLNLNGEKDE